MLSFMPSGGHPPHHNPQPHHPVPPPTSSTMFEDDFLSTRARSFPLSHGLMPTPQPFPFAGFPMHHAPDPMASFTGEYSVTTFKVNQLALCDCNPLKEHGDALRFL